MKPWPGGKEWLAQFVNDVCDQKTSGSSLCSIDLFLCIHNAKFWYCIIITIVTYVAIPEEFVAVWVAMSMEQTSDIFSSIAWYYGDNDFIIWTFDFIARSDVAHVTCSTDTVSHVTCSKKYDCYQLHATARLS